MKKIKLLISCVLLGLPTNVYCASLLTGGHIDGPAFGYDSVDGFEPHFHNEGGSDGAIIDGVRITSDTEYEPDELVIMVRRTSTVMIGLASYYWLPETEADADTNMVPFLGLGLEELDPLDWDNGTVTISLNVISSPAGSHFRLWQDDGFGGAIDFINTDGVPSGFDLAAGSHTHFNWGFTELGDYELEWSISGIHLVDGIQSGSASYFYAVPEPSTAILGALGLLAGLRRRR